MPISTNPIADQIRYRTSTGSRLVSGVLVPLMVLSIANIGLEAMAIWQKLQWAQRGTLAMLAGMLPLMALVLHSMVSGVFSRAFIIASDRIIEQRAWPFADKQLLFEEIAGFRPSAKFTTIQPKRPELPTLTITSATEAYEELLLWLGDFCPNLDRVEVEVAEATLLADGRLGATAETRATWRALARQIRTVLNVVSAALAAWLVVLPSKYAYPWAITASILIPLLAAGALLLFPRLVRLVASNSPQPAVALPLLLPSFGLLVRGLADIELLAYATAWPVVAAVMVIFGLLLLASARNFLSDRITWGFVFVCATMYSYGATLTGNVAFDTKAPTLYRAQVLDKYRTTGGGAFFYLKVTPWGSRLVSEYMPVSSSYYQREQPGDSVTIATRPGRLGIAWFRVVEQ